MRNIGKCTVVNVVATCTIDGKLNCVHIAQNTPNCEHEPKRFAALKHRMRFGNHAPTFLVFTSGKIVCVGTRSKEMAFAAIHRLLAHFKEIWAWRPYQEITLGVQNIVAHAATGFPLALDRIARDRWDTTHYEPELFPGLKYDVMREGKRVAVCNLFSSGKMVVTGVTDGAAITAALSDIDAWISDYKSGAAQPG